MARCNNEELLKKLGINKLTEQVEVDFTLHKELPDCRKINTKNYSAVSGTVTYNKYRVPANAFECMRKGCVNSGTLIMASASETVTFRVKEDATEFAAGVVTFYVAVPAGATFPVTVTFKISGASNFTNADVYTVSVTQAMVGADGFAPIVIDLSQTPSSEEGTGWAASNTGAYIQLSASAVVGFSSIAIFDSILDFEINDTVKVGCLSTVGGSFDVSAIESACARAQYDDSVTSFSYTVTGRKVTPNYWKLNPLMAKGTKTKGFQIATVKETVAASGGYGKITLPDVYQEECGFVAVQLADGCDATDSTLTELSVPTLITLDLDHFQVIKNADGTTDIMFNADHVGTDMLVSYPKEVDIEETVASIDNLNGTRVRMTVPYCADDGIQYRDIFDNVLITSFPANITNTDGMEFSFTITIFRDENGYFFRRQKIVA